MMDDVFLNEVDLNCHGEWQTNDGGEVSFLAGIAEGEADVLAVKIDIAAPLATLKAILQHKLGIDLSHCEIWLQDILQLAEETTLSEQCIQGEGAVQVNLELKSVQNVDRINILDVLKPQDEDLPSVSDDNTTSVVETDTIITDNVVKLEECLTNETVSCASPVLEEVELPLPDSLTSTENVIRSASKVITSNNHVIPSSVANVLPAVPVKGLNTNINRLSKPSVNTNENITRWVMDSGFRRDQDRLKIPLDPALWTQVHVQHWIVWAINQFNLKNVNPAKWSWIDGPALCNMSHTDFTSKVPDDPNDLFWTHLELLRKCKFVGVIQKPVPYLQYVTTPLTVKGDSSKSNRPFSTKTSPSKAMQADTALAAAASGNRAGSNGQVQLWQFLLELLTDKNFRDAISWLGTTGEFKLNNPEMVAQLWGERKNKPNMNYEKLSRALRYYYDGQLINKVSGKRFVYKFVCDLKELLGYSAEELNRLVTECDQRSKARRAASVYM